MLLGECVCQKEAIVKSSNYADILNVRIALELSITFSLKTVVDIFYNQIGL